MINREEQGTVGRTDEGKTYTELGVKRTPMTGKKKNNKMRDMARKAGKEMPYSMGNKNQYNEGSGQRFPMGAKSSMSSGGGMPYNMGKASDKMTERSRK